MAQRSPLLQDVGDRYRHFAIDHFAIGNRHPRPVTLVGYVKMGRIVARTEIPRKYAIVGTYPSRPFHPSFAVKL